MQLCWCTLRMRNIYRGSITTNESLETAVGARLPGLYLYIGIGMSRTLWRSKNSISTRTLTHSHTHCKVPSSCHWRSLLRLQRQRKNCKQFVCDTIDTNKLHTDTHTHTDIEGIQTDFHTHTHTSVENFSPGPLHPLRQLSFANLFILLIAQIFWNLICVACLA